MGAAAWTGQGTILKRIVRALDGRRLSTQTYGDPDGRPVFVRDLEFRSSHEPLGGEVWRRVGTFRAWQVAEDSVLRTMEGKAIARPGDWVVEGYHGERWPVADEQFRRTYRMVRRLP